MGRGGIVQLAANRQRVITGNPDYSRDQILESRGGEIGIRVSLRG